MKAATPGANRAALARRRQRATSQDCHNEKNNQSKTLPPRQQVSFQTGKIELAPDPKNEQQIQPSIHQIEASPTSNDNNRNLGNVNRQTGPRRSVDTSQEDTGIHRPPLPKRQEKQTSEPDQSSPVLHPGSEHESAAYIFSEDPEPLVHSNDDILDAKVLSHKALVAIKSCFDGQVLHLNEGDPEKKARMTSHLDAPPLEIHLPSCSNQVIRYGTSVAIYSTISKCYLGVRITNKGDNDNITFELGFFQGSISEVEKWTILHGNRQLLIGSALQSAKKSETKGKTAAVRSGDPLVLRNNVLGGLLSLHPVTSNDSNKTKDISLVTQSYCSDGGISRNSLLDRALHHYEIFPTDSELFQLCLATIPPCPRWIYDSTKELNAPRSETNNNLKAKSRIEQEQLLLDEVIASLMGLEGNVLRKVGDEFQISSEVNISLRSLIERTLPIATGFCKVKSFLRIHQPGYEHGLVHQALCEEIDSILGEYLSFVEILDKRFHSMLEGSVPSTMNQSFIEIQRLLSIISLLQDVIEDGRDKIGGALINALLNLKMTVVRGDYHKQILINRLLEKTSVPWMTMLTHWLADGDLEDPLGEFMIDKKHEIAVFSGDNWNSIFSIRHEHVITGVISSPFLEEKILMTGKYWNAVHHCEGIALQRCSSEVEGTSKHVLRYNDDPSSVAIQIEKAYKKASSHLLKLLLGRFAVEKSLLTIKRYFLLDQGDFLVNFMDTAEKELTKLMEHVSRGRTQHWLSMALQLSESLNEDIDSLRTTRSTPQPLTPNCIRCFFFDESLDEILGIRESEPRTPSRHPYGQVAGLTGMLSFSLDFREVPFPTSLLVSKRNLSSYQMLFRHIFYTKYIEKRLVGVWLENQMMKEYQEVRQLLGRTFCLRQRMLHFVQNFLYYMMLEVIEPNWIKMSQCIRQQETVDELVDLHDKFLQTTMEDCLLTNASLFKSLAKTMSTCLTFSEQMKRFFLAINKTENSIATRRRGDMSSRRMQFYDMSQKERQAKKKAQKQAILAEKNERDSKHKRHVNNIQRELNNSTYDRMIRRHAEVFDDNLEDLMRKLRSKVALHSKIDNLCIRLDYNGYLSKQSA